MDTEKKLSAFEVLALKALRGGIERGKSRPSEVGFEIWKECDPETRKRNPSPQGMALFASKFLRALHLRGLASNYHGWYATMAGLKVLQDMEEVDHEQ